MLPYMYPLTAVTESQFLVPDRHRRESLSTPLTIGAAFVIRWALLLLGILGPTPLGVGMAAQLIHYGVSIRRCDGSAVSMGWSATIAMGAVTLLIGVTPIMLTVWVTFLLLSLLLTFGPNPQAPAIASITK